MKLMLSVIAVMMLSSCYEPNIGMGSQTKTDSTTTKKDTVFTKEIEVNFSSISLYVVEVDSCEYLYGPWGNASVLTHKGNCKFCTERKQ